jgi:hypothetical protein
MVNAPAGSSLNKRNNDQHAVFMPVRIPSTRFHVPPVEIAVELFLL